MHTASSAKRTCKELRSASEYTATVEMPNSLQAQMTRRAISPRFATSIFWNIDEGGLLFAAGTYAKERLPVLHGLPIFHKNLHDFSGGIGFDFVHQLHGFHDAQRLAHVHVRPNFHEGLGARAGGFIIGAHNGRFDQMQVLAGTPFGRTATGVRGSMAASLPRLGRLPSVEFAGNDNLWNSRTRCG